MLRCSSKRSIVGVFSSSLVGLLTTLRPARRRLGLRHGGLGCIRHPTSLQVRSEGGEFSLAEFAISFDGIAPGLDYRRDMFSGRVEPESLFALRIHQPNIGVTRHPQADDVLPLRYVEMLVHVNSSLG